MFRMGARLVVWVKNGWVLDAGLTGIWILGGALYWDYQGAAGYDRLGLV